MNQQREDGLIIGDMDYSCSVSSSDVVLLYDKTLNPANFLPVKAPSRFDSLGG